MLTLGVETSCDETSVAVVDSGRRILSNVILSQDAHRAFGGVIPEVASREHLKQIIPIYRQALADAGVTLDDIELIAATQGPGLVGPLLVGLSFAKGLSWARKLPFAPVNHLEGHLTANLLEHPNLQRQHICLIVSGGHTLLIEMKDIGQYTVLGTTRDDAAGEAFDKVAKILGLGYPGGAALDRLAATGNPEAIPFPRPMLKEAFTFSFSGLKTAVALHIQKLSPEELDASKPDIAASFQEAVVDVLVEKCLRAAKANDINQISLSGGVAANSRLRRKLGEAVAKSGRELFFPSIPLCTDNGAMIAAAGYYAWERFGPGELIANAIPYLKLA